LSKIEKGAYPISGNEKPTDLTRMKINKCWLNDCIWISNVTNYQFIACKDQYEVKQERNVSDIQHILINNKYIFDDKVYLFDGFIHKQKSLCFGKMDLIRTKKSLIPKKIQSNKKILVIYDDKNKMVNMQKLLKFVYGFEIISFVEDNNNTKCENVAAYAISIFDQTFNNQDKNSIHDLIDKNKGCNNVNFDLVIIFTQDLRYQILHKYFLSQNISNTNFHSNIKDLADSMIANEGNIFNFTEMDCKIINIINTDYSFTYFLHIKEYLRVLNYNKAYSIFSEDSKNSLITFISLFGNELDNEILDCFISIFYHDNDFIDEIIANENIFSLEYIFSSEVIINRIQKLIPYSKFNFKKINTLEICYQKYGYKSLKFRNPAYNQRKTLILGTLEQNNNVRHLIEHSSGYFTGSIGNIFLNNPIIEENICDLKTIATYTTASKVQI
jgi:hypothetical protein